MNLANKITLVRIFLVPIFMLFLTPIPDWIISADGWAKDENGEKLHWILDDYNYEGIRKQHWFIDGVVKYHRTLSTIVNTLIENNFSIIKILEPIATEKAEKFNPKLMEERRRPPFVIIKAQKIN